MNYCKNILYNLDNTVHGQIKWYDKHAAILTIAVYERVHSELKYTMYSLVYSLS